MGEGQPRIPEEAFREPSPEQEAKLPALERLEMYRLPGDPPLTEHDVERYQESNAKFDRAIPHFIERGLGKSHFIDKRLAAVRFIPEAPESDRTRLWEKGVVAIESGLLDVRPASHTLAIPLIAEAPESERPRLWKEAIAFIERGSKDKDRYQRQMYLEHIPDVPEPDRTRLWKEAAEAFAERINFLNIDLISWFPEAVQPPLWEKATTLVEQMLDDKYTSFYGNGAVDAVFFLPGTYRARLWEKVIPRIEGFLMSDDPHNRVFAIKTVEEIPGPERARLIGRGLETTSIVVREMAMERIPLAPEADRAALVAQAAAVVERGLDADDIREQELIFRLLPLVPEEEQARLWKKALPVLEKGIEHDDAVICIRALEHVASAPLADQPQLWEKAAAHIEQRLGSPDYDHRRTAMLEAAMLPEPFRVRLIERGIDDAHEVRNEAMSVMERLSEQERREILASHPDLLAHLKEVAGQTPLYGNYPKRFFSKAFAKTHSGTTLLDAVPGRPDESLRERVILRHIGAFPYFAWRKAFEDAEFWKGKGFDYVPVEPIVSVAENAKRTGVDVATRVLKGPSLRDWLSETRLYAHVLSELSEHIERCLEELGVEHEHIHMANFVTVFERDEQGEPDLAKPPRVYVIDFDMAASSGESRPGRSGSRKKP